MGRLLAIGLAGVLALGWSGAFADTPVGWRTDGTGLYPDASPPTEWSPEKNVLWRTPIDRWSNSTVVLAGDRLFTCAEPDRLLCLRKSDGHVLWDQPIRQGDTWSEADRKVAEAKRAETEALKKKYRELDDRINDAYARLRKLERGTEEYQKVRAEFKGGQNEQKEVRHAIAANARWAPAQTEPTNGYTSATPVTDGRHVWVILGTGVAACLDMDGQRKWTKFIDSSTEAYGYSASPLLADGKLLLHVRQMKAFAPLTGEQLWEAEGTRHAWGTSFITRAGRTTVAVTPKGDVVRVADGKVLLHGFGALDYNSPIVHDGVAYYIQNGGGAVRIAVGPDGTLGSAPLWKTEPKKDRYYASPVLHDGLLYDINQRNHFSVIDATTGAVVSEQDLPLGKGTVYPSIVLAGKHLFVSNDNGTTLVMQPGRDGKILATNHLDTFRSTPVFEGSRMFVRTYKFLYCIGVGPAAQPASE